MYREKLIFFGDSIAFGQGISISKTWVVKVSQLLQSMNPNLEVINSSINGRTTRQALEDMPYHVQNAGVSVLFIQFGLNDANYWQSDKGLPRVSLDAFIANIKEMIIRGFHFGAKKIIINNNHPVLRKDSFLNLSIGLSESNKLYNAALRNLMQNSYCKNNTNIIFNDIEKHFEKYSDISRFILPLPDGIHLSEQGHDVYYDIMKASIKKGLLLKEQV